MSRFMRGLFQTARTISTIDPTALLFAPGGTLPHGGVCCMVQRWNVCAIVFWRVVWYRAGTFLLCDHVRARRGAAWPWRGCGRAVASAVFVSPSCGCDTPTNASVCNGFGGVCVVLVCYLTG